MVQIRHPPIVDVAVRGINTVDGDWKQHVSLKCDFDEDCHMDTGYHTYTSGVQRCNPEACHAVKGLLAVSVVRAKEL